MTDAPSPDLIEPVTRIQAALEATPKKSRRVLLRTLLKEFGFKIKSGDRLTRIQGRLAEVGIHVNPDLAECDREDWVTLSLIAPALPNTDPPASTMPGFSEDPWFTEVKAKTFASEREVEIRFILPLLERLGYREENREENRADGFPVDIVVGVRRTRAEADFVLFDGPNRDANHALLVVEAKRAGKRLSDHVGQARSYAMFLQAPYYLLTNGDDIRVFLYRSPIESDVEVYTGHRESLLDNFADLYTMISREAVVEYRRAWVRRGNT
ncbi:type I restriction enzyme HsdR N-terminal domain-containing protein [Deinococcus fonticola]|uniref:type I restriction enzyme HsdR N-terminal domain-containing protein n=1 Tax=Deinococcus fonticola TaxID=2528713 RepID=UPI001074A261|nr:type I restriction enzyme HsdR N-terminal domain-containing protein [Deinococcus fonticola]